MRVDNQLDPGLKALGFNFSKAQPFQVVGFQTSNLQPYDEGLKAAVEAMHANAWRLSYNPVGSRNRL